MPTPKQDLDTILWEALRGSLSSARLGRYVVEGDATDDWFARYLWNVALCRALYPALHLVEIAVRNRVNAAMNARHPVTKRGEYADVRCWIDAVPSILHQKDRPFVEAAKQKLREENAFRRPEDRTLSPGRLVAALNFGFWTCLFDSRYDENGGAPAELWPHLAATVFPAMPRTLRTRRTMSAYLAEVRRLRNRVFHHEPLWRDEIHRETRRVSNRMTALEERVVTLGDKHARLHEFLGWVDPLLGAAARRMDDFPSIYAAGPTAFRPLTAEIHALLDATKSVITTLPSPELIVGPSVASDVPQQS